MPQPGTQLTGCLPGALMPTWLLCDRLSVPWIMTYQVSGSLSVLPLGPFWSKQLCALNRLDHLKPVPCLSSSEKALTPPVMLTPVTSHCEFPSLATGRPVRHCFPLTHLFKTNHFLAYRSVDGIFLSPLRGS